MELYGNPVIKVVLLIDCINGNINNKKKENIMNTNNMTRAEAYSAIKSMGLQNACVKKFGKNFTMCKTIDLIALVQSNGAAKPAPVAPKAETKKEEDVETPVNAPEASAPVAPASNGGECVDTVARAAISKLVEILEDNGTIEDYEKEKVISILGGKVAVSAEPSEEYKPKSASPYSDDEIDDMFAGMGVN
nr:MAG TPA: hypothetical protein [Crassvirales sp.]